MIQQQMIVPVVLGLSAMVGLVIAYRIILHRRRRERRRQRRIRNMAHAWGWMHVFGPKPKRLPSPARVVRESRHRRKRREPCAGVFATV